MELRQLGSTGVAVPEIGVGTWRYQGGIEPIRRGLELGATLVDTAEVYGSEDVVGQAIREQRDRVFLATKVSGRHLRHDQVLDAAKASLKRLQTDVIDLYQIHWPSDSDVPIGETMRALEELVDAGKVRFIGVSNFSRRQLEEAQATMQRHRIVANQVEYSLSCRDIEAEIEPFYEANGIAVIAYSPLGQGELLTPGKSRGFGELQAVAREVDKTPAQVALNWCLAHRGVIAIPKSDHAERVAENCGASGWYLTPDQVARLSRAYA